MNATLKAQTHSAKSGERRTVRCARRGPAAIRRTSGLGKPPAHGRKRTEAIRRKGNPHGRTPAAVRIASGRWLLLGVVVAFILGVLADHFAPDLLRICQGLWEKLPEKILDAATDSVLPWVCRLTRRILGALTLVRPFIAAVRGKSHSGWFYRTRIRAR